MPRPRPRLRTSTYVNSRANPLVLAPILISILVLILSSSRASPRYTLRKSKLLASFLAYISSLPPYFRPLSGYFFSGGGVFYYD